MQNDSLRLTLEPATARWKVEARQQDNTWLDGITFRIDYRQQGEQKSWQSGSALSEREFRPISAEKDGNLQALGLEIEPATDPFRVLVEFELRPGSSLLRWQLNLTNCSAEDLRIDRVWLLRVGEPRPSWLHRLFDRLRGIEPEHKVVFNGQPPDLWFMDGWQSWSFAGALRDKGIVTGTRLGPATGPMYLNPAAPKVRGKFHFNSDMYAISGNASEKSGFLIGQLSEQHAYASIEGWHGGRSGLRLSNALEGKQLSPDETWVCDPAALQFLEFDQPEPHADYLEAVGLENQARAEGETPAGWCSWYYYFDQVHEEDISRNVAWIEQNQGSMPLKIVQLDDGFQADIGDWLELNERFSKGHRALVREVKDAGFIPGLWLAPFIAKPSAEIVRSHPEWVLRKRNGRPVRAGYNWGTFFVPLDITNPEVQDYISEVVATAVKDWGYHYLKLDFLYAASLLGDRWDSNKTGAEALRMGLEIIREAAGEEVFLSGCGCPLGPAIGLVDSMRIGADVAPRWQPAYQGIEAYFRQEPSLPSLRNALQNSLTRSAMHGRWWQNDPDCLLMRSEDTHLSHHEVQLLATVVALSGGAMMFSDDMTQLSRERVDWAAKLLPPMSGRPVVLDQFDKLRPQLLLKEEVGPIGRWWLLALINWSAAQRKIRFDGASHGLPAANLVGVDYWNNEPIVSMDGTFEMNVPAHGVKLLQLRQHTAALPQWLGDTLHISGGSVVKDWEIEGRSLSAQIDLQRQGSGSAWLHTPGKVQGAAFNGVEIPAQKNHAGFSCLELEEVGRGLLRVHWN